MQSATGTVQSTTGMQRWGAGAAPTYGRYVELVGIAQRFLQFSNVSEKDKVLINTDTRKNKNVVDAFFAAAIALGAETSLIVSPPRMRMFSEQPALVVEAAKHADVVIDLITVSHVYTQSTVDILSSGARIIAVYHDEDDLVRLPPRDDIARRVKVIGEQVAACDEMRFVTAAGTDLVMETAGRNVMANYVSEKAGTWTTLCLAGVISTAIEESVNGRMVLGVGDKLGKLHRSVREPIFCNVESGRLMSIEGGEDAKLLSDWFASWKDPNIYVFAHMGIGCDPRASRSDDPQYFLDWESIYGGVTCAFGSNFPLGGKTRAKSHHDLVLLDPDVYFDGKQILDKGEFVQEALRAPDDLAGAAR